MKDNKREAKPSRKTGKVVSNKKYLDGTIVIEVQHMYHNRKYNKKIPILSKYTVQYDEMLDSGERRHIEIGETVLVEQCRPVSKTKHYRLIRRIT